MQNHIVVSSFYGAFYNFLYQLWKQKCLNEKQNYPHTTFSLFIFLIKQK